jgi:hypothetical protein
MEAGRRSGRWSNGLREASVDLLLSTRTAGALTATDATAQKIEPLQPTIPGGVFFLQRFQNVGVKPRRWLDLRQQCASQGFRDPEAGAPT